MYGFARPVSPWQISSADLKERYRVLALHHHPDRVRQRIAQQRRTAAARRAERATAKEKALSADGDDATLAANAEVLDDENVDWSNSRGAAAAAAAPFGSSVLGSPRSAFRTGGDGAAASPVKKCNVKAGEEEETEEEEEEEEDDGGAFFSRLTDAWTVLGDEANRSMYDLVVGVVADTAAERRRITRLKREDAERTVALMEEEVQARRDEERECDGLVILEARYGDCENLSRLGLGYDLDIWTGAGGEGEEGGGGATNKRGAGASGGDGEGRHIDVTVPCQCLVEDSRLILAGGSSKAWLDGFYDPNGMDASKPPNTLFVRYLFLGQLHECSFSDHDAVCLPVEAHAVTDQEVEAYRRAAAHARLRARTTRRRRRALALAATAALSGYALLRHKDSLAALAVDIWGAAGAVARGEPAPAATFPGWGHADWSRFPEQLASARETAERAAAAAARRAQALWNSVTGSGEAAAAAAAAATATPAATAATTAAAASLVAGEIYDARALPTVASMTAAPRR